MAVQSVYVIIKILIRCDVPNCFINFFRFVTQIKDRTDLVEMQQTNFECQLAPVGDPNMKVEWFLNNKPLAHSKYSSAQYCNSRISTRALPINFNHFSATYRKSSHSHLRFWLRGHEFRLDLSRRQW